MTEKSDQQLLYEGEEKDVLRVGDSGRLIQRFKDAVVVDDDASRVGRFDEKGACNNLISSMLFRYLHQKGVKTHFVDQLNDNDMLVRHLTMFPFMIVVRNVVAGRLAQRLGLVEGEPISGPIIEHYYKRTDLEDPLINRDHIEALDLASREDLEFIEERSLQINALLKELLARCGFDLVDLRLEFGRDSTGEVLVGDEISPDTCRIWDRITGRRLDKDIFRRDLGDLMEAYGEVRDCIVDQLGEENISPPQPR